MKTKNLVGGIIMSAAILASVPLGVNRSLIKLRDRAAEDYYYDKGGYAIYEGIEKRREAAQNLITVAERYTQQEPGLEGLIDELEYRISASENAWSGDDTFWEEAEANRNLDPMAAAIASTLEELDLSERDKKYPGQMIAQMESEQDKIERSSYNDDARSFNQKVERLRPIALVKPMATFEGWSEESPPVEEGTAATTRDTGKTAEQIAQRTAKFGEDMGQRAQEYGEAVGEQVGDFVDDVLDDIFE